MINSPDKPTPAPRKPREATSRDTDLIGRNLRSLYGGIEQEALPPKFLELLDRLAKGDGK